MSLNSARTDKRGARETETYDRFDVRQHDEEQVYFEGHSIEDVDSCSSLAHSMSLAHSFSFMSRPAVIPCLQP